MPLPAQRLAAPVVAGSINLPLAAVPGSLSINVRSPIVGTAWSVGGLSISYRSGMMAENVRVLLEKSGQILDAFDISSTITEDHQFHAYQPPFVFFDVNSVVIRLTGLPGADLNFSYEFNVAYT